MALTHFPIEEILDREIPERYPFLGLYFPDPHFPYYSEEDRQFNMLDKEGFWEQRLTFLLIVQEAIAS